MRFWTAVVPLMVVAVAACGDGAAASSDAEGSMGASRPERRPDIEVQCPGDDMIMSQIIDTTGAGGDASPREALQGLEQRYPALPTQQFAPLDDEADGTYYKLLHRKRVVVLAGVSRYDDGTFGVGYLEACPSFLARFD